MTLVEFLNETLPPNNWGGARWLCTSGRITVDRDGEHVGGRDPDAQVKSGDVVTVTLDTRGREYSYGVPA